MATPLTIYLDDLDEARMRLVAHEKGRAPEELAQAAVSAALLEETRGKDLNRLYTCPVCKSHDPNRYLSCNRPDCTDGRDPR